MSELENVLDGIESEEISKEVEDKVKEAYEHKKNKRAFDVFEDDVSPRKVDIDSLKKYARMFSASSPEGIVIPNEKMEVLDRILEKIDSLGFTFRSFADKKEPLNSIVTDKFNRKEFYLPWKAFNDSVDAKVSKPSKHAVETACWLDISKREGINNAKGINVPREDLVADYNLLSPAIKNFSARTVHICLGDDVETVLNFVIVYTECGSESTRGLDWKKAGRTAYFIEYCHKLNIPVFNLSNAAFELKLNEYLDTFK